MKKLTQAQLKRMVEILQEARKDLARERYIFVCHAIIGPEEIVSEERLYLCHWVMNMIAPSTVFDDWYFREHGLEKYIDSTQANLQQARVAWVDWMINELKKEIK